MDEAAQLAARINALMPHLKSGTLRIFGEWFGKPMDSIHVMTGATIVDGCTAIAFDAGEVLRIWDPRDYVVESDTFVVMGASRVSWHWYAYGMPREDRYRQARDYSVQGSRVLVTEAGGGTTHYRAWELSPPASELL